MKLEMMMRLLNAVASDAAPGTAAAPSAPAAPAAPAAPDQPGVIQEVDFEALSKEFESDDGDVLEPDVPSTAVEPDEPEIPPAQVTPPAAAPAQPAPAAAPAVPPAPAPAPAAATPPAAAPAPAPVTPPAAPAAAPTPPPRASEEPLTPEKIEAGYAAYREKILPQLEKMYQLSPEQVAAIESNPAQVIPQLAAQIHYNAQVAAYTGIMSQMPPIIRDILAQARSEERAIESFFKEWPELQDERHAETLGRTLSAYRQANPKVDLATMIKQAGTMAMLSCGLDPNRAASAPVAVIPQAPARPAGTAGSGAVRSPQGASNVFEQMAEEMRLED